MVVRLVEEFHTAGVRKLLEALQNFGRVFEALFDERAGHGEGDAEAALMVLDKLQHEGVHGQVALFGHLLHHSAVFFHIFVVVVNADIEETEFAQAVGLMHLEIKTDGRHGSHLA